MLIQLTIKEIFGAFAMAFVISCAMTPVAIWLAPKIHAMDIPKARGMHDKPMPRFGGMAIYLGTMCSILYFLHGNENLPAILVGGTLIYALGAADDIVKGGLNAKFKFACQTAIAVLMYYMGLRITFITNYFGGGHWQFGTAVCLIVTVLWIVGITNTINLIDGLDGLAAGVAAIAALSIAYVAYIHGDRYGMMVVCVGMMAIAGSSLGFLPFNFYPAKLFMGDSGSLFLGFMIAIFAVISPLKRSTLLAVIVPVLVLGIPIFDTAFAILRRVVSGKPIMSPDKEHLHHHLMRLGYGQRRAVLMIYGICAIMGMAAVIMSRDLYLESVMLILTAFLYIYVFLTDQNHKVPVIRMQDAKEKDRSEEKNTDDSKADEKKPDDSKDDGNKPVDSKADGKKPDENDDKQIKA